MAKQAQPQIKINRIAHERLRDDGWIDEVRIVTIPRFKTSGMSGDEWRQSARLQFVRKGQVLYERTAGNVEAALLGAGWWLATGFEGTSAEYERKPTIDFDSLCDQPGCAEPIEVVYRLKSLCVDNRGTMIPAERRARGFCRKHAHRGDSDLEDCDENYEAVDGKAPDGVEHIPETDVSRSRQVIIKVGSVEEIPDKVRALRRKP